MSCHNNRDKSEETPRQSEHSGKVLALFGVDAYEPSIQFYNFLEKKWSPLRKIDNGTLRNGVIINDKIYYITETDKKGHFQVFDLTTRRITNLHPTDSILHESSICTDGRFVYFCGERNSDNSGSAQVIKYDPQTNSFETLPPMPTKRWGATGIFNQDCLYVLGGFDCEPLLTVEKYDPKTKEWTALAPLELWGCGIGVFDGKLYACGGQDNDVQVYEAASDSWQPVARMNKARINCSLVAHEGKLLAIAGDGERTTEVYDPSINQWRMDDEMTAGLRLAAFTGGFVSTEIVTDDY